MITICDPIWEQNWQNYSACKYFSDDCKHAWLQTWLQTCSFFIQAYDLTEVVITICDPIWEQNWQNYSACKYFSDDCHCCFEVSVICQSALILLICVVKATRSTQRVQTSLAEADHYCIAHCKIVEPWWWKTTPLPPPPPKKKKKKKKKKKRFGSLPAPRSGYATTIIMFYFAHLLILEYPDHHQNLISSSLYYPGPHPKISSQSAHKF